MPRLIERHEIIGQRVQNILYTYELLDDYLDHVWNYFVLDSGLAFYLPGFSDEPFTPAEIPHGAKPTNHPLMAEVSQSRIARLLRPRDEEEWSPDNVYLLTDSGLVIYQKTTAPAATASAGIRIERDTSFIGNNLVDFWD